MLQESRAKLAPNQALQSYVGDESGTTAPRVGADLRLARERLGYPLEVMADALRIRWTYLHALEDGRIEDLPGTVYAMAFLRSYALALGLDPDEISRRFRIEADEISHRTELEFPTPAPSRAVPGGALMLLGLVLAVGSYAGWYQLSGHGRLPAETVAPVPTRLAPLAQQALPAAVPVPIVAPAPVVPAITTPLPEMPAYAPTQAAAMPLPPPPPPAPPVVAAPAPAPGTAVEGRIVVRVKGQVWIRVRDRAGPVLFDRVLNAGDSYTMPNKAGLLLSTGNALATEFLVDGELTPGLGGAKGVKRDLALEADTLRDGRFAAQYGIAPPPAGGNGIVQPPGGGNGTVTRTP